MVFTFCERSLTCFPFKLFCDIRLYSLLYSLYPGNRYWWHSWQWVYCPILILEYIQIKKQTSLNTSVMPRRSANSFKIPENFVGVSLNFSTMNMFLYNLRKVISHLFSSKLSNKGIWKCSILCSYTLLDVPYYSLRQEIDKAVNKTIVMGF